MPDIPAPVVMVRDYETDAVIAKHWPTHTTEAEHRAWVAELAGSISAGQYIDDDAWWLAHGAER